MTTENEEFKAGDEIPEELMPDPVDRLLMAYQFILEDSPLNERLDEIFSLLEKDDDEAAIEALEKLSTDVSAEFQESAELARFDFFPHENEDLAFLKLRFEIQAMISVIESPDEPEDVKKDLDYLEEAARQTLERVNSGVESALDFGDGLLTPLEGVFISSYFPEFMDDLKKEAAGSGD